jgi:hypothetical protein
MRTEWKDDSRDEIGFGIPEANPPTVASVRIAANKAVRMAVLLLGEKVSDSVIEAQARDFMALNGEAMDRTLDRFAKTQKLYADADEDADDAEEVEAKSKKSADEKEEKEEKTASAALADKGSAVPPAISTKETEVKAEDKKEEEKPAEVKAEDKKEEEKPVEAKAEVKAVEVKAEEKKEEDKVEARLAKLEGMIASIAAAVAPKVAAEEKKMPDFIQKKIDEKAEKDEKKAADEKEEKKEEVKAADEKEEKKEEVKAADATDDKAEEKEASAKKSDDDADEDDAKEASVRKVGQNEMDIELTSSMDDALPEDPAADAQLASLFDDGVTAADEEEKDEDKKAKSKKAGIKKLGGQPKVAAQVGAGQADISSIWQSAPDVSELFK